MTIDKPINLIIGKSDLIMCPPLLVEKSHLLSDIKNIRDTASEPISLPKFITKQIILNVISILEDGNFDKITNSLLEYLIQVEMTLDFLGIMDFSNLLLSLIADRISNENGFRVIKLTYRIPCFYNVTMKAVTIMMKEIQDYYNEIGFSEVIEDPFVHHYAIMTIVELKTLILYCDKYYTVARIVTFKNWIEKNPGYLGKVEILEIVDTINKEGTYIPRCQIKFMRKMKDFIIQKLVPEDIHLEQKPRTSSED